MSHLHQDVEVFPSNHQAPHSHFHWQFTEPLILASGSDVRHQLLTHYQIPHQVTPSTVDEGRIIQGFLDGSPPHSVAQASTHWSELATLLALEKAKDVQRQHPDRWILGADQICVLGQTRLSKPGTPEKAVEQLLLLQGQTHQLITATCLLRPNAEPWTHADVISLTMAPWSKTALEEYVAQDHPIHSCGSYRIEGQGRRLFSAIEGPADSIQGLPLLALLHHLTNIQPHPLQQPNTYD